MINSGKICFFGVTLEKHQGGSSDSVINGSVVLFKAESEEQVWELLRGDAYAKGGAWDLEKASVWAFKSG